MKLNEEQMYVIEKADKLTNCYSSTIEETHWLNEEEAFSLIESFVESPLNGQINELNKNLEAQDKIINTQALEIARLNEKINIYEDPDDMTLMFMWCDDKAKDKIKELRQRIDKAKEYVKKEEHSNWVLYGRNVLLKILGDKEDED